MSLTKFASFEVSEVLDIKSAPAKVKTASLRTLADFHDLRTDDGYLYVRIRAISSRVNKNHDGWPTAELAGGPEEWERLSSAHTSSEGFTVEASRDSQYGFSTFIGKPIFVDHNNSNPDRARGVIVDSKFNVLDHKTAAEGDDYWGSDDVDPEHFPASEVELLLEVDAKSFPKFAEAIVSGDLDGFSMGCDVEYSKCSHCGHKATNPNEYCSHITMKGAEHTFESGTKKGKSGRSYENCYGIGFFEISGVFDPADETALTREIHASLAKEGEVNPYHKPSPEEVMQVARRVLVDNPGMTLSDAMVEAEQELSTSFSQPVAGGDGAAYNFQVKDTIPKPVGVDLGVPHQGKTAEAPEPQAMHTKAPEDVDTLRQEKICPLCGSDMDDVKCDVCGYEEPPDSLQNPNLEQAGEVDETGIADGQVDQPVPADGEVKPGSPLQARKGQPTASVNNEMRWEPKGIDTSKLAAPKPQGDEPDETVTSDQTTPVTSAYRTAQDMIEAAKRNQENKNMSDQTKVAADPADASGKPDKRVDVEGVGGVTDATNEQASKPEGKHGEPGVTVDVEGKGGVLQDSNAEASKPDESQSVEQTSDNAGFQPGGQKGPDTQTWDNSNEPGSAVTDKAFPTAAKKGTDPVDPVGKADKRVDVEEEVPHALTGPGTDQWTGTDGNGVTRQQDPVTKKVDPNIEQRSSGFISIAALKLADAEVELGITSVKQKYERLAELADLDESEIAAEYRALSKVKTAGLTRTASKGGVGRVPSFKRIASDEVVTESVPETDERLDSAVFSR